MISKEIKIDRIEDTPFQTDIREAVELLRKTKARQIKGRANDGGDGFCAFGVILYGSGGGDVWGSGGFFSDYDHARASSRIVNWNDKYDYTFKEIAGLLEAEYLT